jgi:hypothetical protein
MILSIFAREMVMQSLVGTHCLISAMPPNGVD